jgi:hypothetical protein
MSNNAGNYFVLNPEDLKVGLLGTGFDVGVDFVMVNFGGYIIEKIDITKEAHQPNEVYIKFVKTT